MKKIILFALAAVLAITLTACCGNPKPHKIVKEVSDSITEEQPKLMKKYEEAGLMMADSLKSSHLRSSFQKITSFTDYVYEEHLIFTRNDSDTVGFLRHLDIEFPTGMHNAKVLAKIQEQLIDTIFANHYHTTSFERALSAHWNISRSEIKHLITYPSEVPKR